MENKNSNDNGGKFREGTKKLLRAVPGIIKRNGVYMLVILALTCAGVLMAVTYRVPEDTDESQIGSVGMVQDESLAEAKGKQPAEQTGDGEKTPIPEFTPPTVTPIPDFTVAPAKTPEPTLKPLLNSPVKGTVIWDFAIDELIYSVTLDQWMTHLGVDIECPLGTEVHCVAAGSVERVYKDSSLGITVIIAHKNGHKSVYSNLCEDDYLVEEGDSVTENLVIGHTGDTASAECLMSPHLHFEYHINGSPVNPKKYVLLP